MILYLSEPHATLRREGNALMATHPHCNEGKSSSLPVLGRVPIDDLDVVLLVGSVHITADATHLCLDHGIRVAWMTSSGTCRGCLSPRGDRCEDLRYAQWQRLHDSTWALDRARAVVAVKILNARRTLEEIFNHDLDRAPPLTERQHFDDLAHQARAADSVASLRGFEGTAARRYFNALANAFRGSISFTGRAQRPSPDPANALLSLGYVLLGNRFAGLLSARGFDSSFGFLHEFRPGRPSLALDLLEEFRHPFVDRFVVRACNLRIFQPRDFEPDAECSGGIRLTRPALKRFFVEWEDALHRPLRPTTNTAPRSAWEAIMHQIELLAADVRGAAEYQPFFFGGTHQCRPPTNSPGSSATTS